MGADTQTDIVIVTALPKERDAVLNYLASPNKVEVKGHTYYKSTIRTENGASENSVVLLSLPGMGNVQAGITTMQAITVWNPSFVILTGIAGGVQGGERFLGDVVVGEQIVGYEPGKLESGKTQRRFQALRPASKLLDAALAMKPDQWVFEAKQQRPDGTSGRVIPKVHFGVVASGEKVVKDLDLVTELRTSWAQLIAIEMESFGTASAAYEAETAPGMMMVKGICDWADPAKNDAWQVYAADIAAAYVVSLLKQIVIQPKKTQARRIDAITYSGRVKVKVCQNLGPNWKDLAEILDIPYRDQARFEKGNEGYEIWQWLDQRSKLDALKQALIDIERRDLADILSEASATEGSWVVTEDNDLSRPSKSSAHNDDARLKYLTKSLAERNQVFISYSRKEIRWLERLQVHLKPLERQGTITRWDDTMIKPGAKWREEIRKALQAAKVAVLLISADFLASDFIATNELPPLLAAAEADGAVILPVIISPCRFEQVDILSQFLAVNSPSRPLVKISRGGQEDVFVKITNTIEAVLRT